MFRVKKEQLQLQVSIICHVNNIFRTRCLPPMYCVNLAKTSHTHSVYGKLQATRAKVAPVNLIYGSHFSATEATYKVSQSMGNYLEFTRTFTRITHIL